MRADAPAWPPKARASSTSTDNPCEAAYTAVASPAGPAPTTATSYSFSASSSGVMPRQAPASASVGSRNTWPFGQNISGSSSSETPARSSKASASRSSAGSRAVAAEKALDAREIGRARRADKCGTGAALVDQPHAAKDEGAHHDLADFGGADHQGADM